MRFCHGHERTCVTRIDELPAVRHSQAESIRHQQQDRSRPAVHAKTDYVTPCHMEIDYNHL